MRHIVQAIFPFAVMAASTLTFADPACDCTTYPFKPDPPCPRICTDAILQHASKPWLVRVLGIHESTAQTIVDARSSGVRTLHAFKNMLGPEQVKQLDNGFSKLSTEKLQEDKELRGLKAWTAEDK